MDWDPSCLDVPDDDRDFGAFFWPIDQAWLESADENWPEWNWNQPLTQVLKSRMNHYFTADRRSLITGAATNPQPAGRYVNYTDLIRMWNQSGGRCICGRDIFLDEGEVTDIEDLHPNDIPALACVQRLDNSIIHLASNCASTMICRPCDSQTNGNVDYSAASANPRCS